jgi:hypothetical protein
MTLLALIYSVENIEFNMTEYIINVFINIMSILILPSNFIYVLFLYETFQFPIIKIIMISGSIMMGFDSPIIVIDSSF